MYSTPFVVLLGVGTVFVGLIVIILLCKIMSFFVNLSEKKSEAAVAPVRKQTVQSALPIQDKPSVIAAISAVVAEELGTEFSNIRIHSIKRV